MDAATDELRIPAPGLRERSKRAKLERLKRVARNLFSRRGFEATTTRAIATAADIGAGTLFLYAASKEDLLVLIFREEVGAAVDNAVATMPPGTLLAQLMHLFGAMIEHHAENPALARIFVKELPFAPDARHGVAGFMENLYARMAALIEAAKARGELRGDIASRQLAENLFGLFYQQLQRWLGGSRTRSWDCRRRVRAALELQLDGLRASDGSAAIEPRRAPRSPRAAHRHP
ncbi:MAG TPA: TetR/AcrR family transcriptional regulator [Candidatus Binataceae bacterium]|nr:TetR/AcrR family transcriptional regulator [Candidatus Binataceae bacterium]